MHMSLSLTLHALSFNFCIHVLHQAQNTITIAELPDSRLARESIMMAANYVRVFHSKPLSSVVWMLSAKS